MTDGQEKWLKWLHERGGSGYVDQYGRVVAGGEQSPQGAMVAWLKLVAAGYISGGQDRVQITHEGVEAIGGPF